MKQSAPSARGVLGRLRRRGPGSLYRSLKSIELLLTRDRRDLIGFLGDPALGHVSRRGRLGLVVRFVRVTNAVRGYHTLGEMLAVTREILRRRSPTVLEAGCGKGGSTAKLSLATRMAGGRLLVFDSFRGIPDNRERHVSLDGRPVEFRRGAFSATLPSVERVVARHGAPEVCRFVKGLFETTLEACTPPLDVVVLDVDLLESTRTCVRRLYPRLAPGGILLTLDGQLRATHELLGDPVFWRREVGVEPPPVVGLGRSKLLRIPASAAVAAARAG